MMVQPFKYPQTNCSVSILSSVFWSGGYSVLKLQLGRVSLDQALFDQKVCSDSILTSSLLDVGQLSNFLSQLFFGDKTNVSANYFVAPRMELKRRLTYFIVILGSFERIIENVLLSTPILWIKHHVLYFSSCISNFDQNSNNVTKPLFNRIVCIANNSELLHYPVKMIQNRHIILWCK